MKFLLPVEIAARRLRDNLFAKLRRFDWFRAVTLLAIRDDVVLVTKQFDDHRLTFSPYESIGNALFRKGHYQRDLANRVLALVGSPPGKTLLEIGVADFYLDDRNYGASSLIKRKGSGDPISVPVRRIDEILRGLQISPDELGLVWMDIEGSEPAAIKSMPELVERRVPIMMEYVPDRYGPVKAREMIEYLSRHYRRCMVFDRQESEIDVCDLPSEGFLDVLFLP